MNAAVKSIKEVIVSGEGDTKVVAFSTALGNVQKQILKDIPDVTLRIEPQAVTVLSAEEKSYTERFFFFFMPRERKKYVVKLCITVEILQIDAETIDFKAVREASPDIVDIPFVSKRLTK